MVVANSGPAIPQGTSSHRHSSSQPSCGSVGLNAVFRWNLLAPRVMCVEIQCSDERNVLERLVKWFAVKRLNVLEAQIQSRDGVVHDVFSVERGDCSHLNARDVEILAQQFKDELTFLGVPEVELYFPNQKERTNSSNCGTPRSSISDNFAALAGDNCTGSSAHEREVEEDDVFYCSSIRSDHLRRNNVVSRTCRAASDPLSLTWSCFGTAKHNFGGSEEFSTVADGPPRILVVSRRHVRKDKFVDYVGEYHIDLITSYGGAAVIVPRTAGTMAVLDCYMPMDGFLVVEGNDISPSYNPYEKSEFTKYSSASCSTTESFNGSSFGLDPILFEEVKRKHASDVDYDPHKDELEWEMLRRALQDEVPFLGICRGCQLLNVQRGGTLHFDIMGEVPGAIPHIDYDNYDGYRHALSVMPKTPMSTWYHDSIDDTSSSMLLVNSYHHQGISSLAPGLEVMATSPDGLAEAFYDPEFYSPENGKFLVGLQFHPERMMGEHKGNQRVYETFMKACKAFRRRRIRESNHDLKK